MTPLDAPPPYVTVQPLPVLEPVIVRALPPAQGDDAFSIIRLDSADLEDQPRLDQALEQVPGVSLFRRSSSLSANPTTQGLSLRAIAPSGSSRALVTLDGVPQNDPFGGWVIWSALPSEDIDSARIVRGAGAGPYGAGALTGVVALEEQSPPFSRVLSGDVEGGSLGMRARPASAENGPGIGRPVRGGVGRQQRRMGGGARGARFRRHTAQFARPPGRPALERGGGRRRRQRTGGRLRRGSRNRHAGRNRARQRNR